MTGDYYRTLQVDPGADPDVITAAYRTLARRLHPDRDITGVEEWRMAELNRAYAVLRDPARRTQYDAERALRLQAVGPGLEESPRRGGLAARWNARAQDAPTSGLSSEREQRRPLERTAMDSHTSTATRLNFGRYAGMTLREIAQQDADYLRWLGRHSSGLRYRQEIEGILRERLESGYSSRSTS